MIRSPFELGDFDFLWGTQANPAAGANLSITVPANARCELVILKFMLRCDANAANRYVMLYAAHGARTMYIAGAEFALTANEDRLVLFGHFGFSSVADGGNTLVVGTPSYPVLLKDDTIVTEILNLQATDQIDGVEYVFKLWPFEQ